MNKLPESFRMFKEQVETLKSGGAISFKALKLLFTSDVDYEICKRALQNFIKVAHYDLRNPSNPYILLVSDGFYIVGVNSDGKLFCNMVEGDRAISSVDSNDITKESSFDHTLVLGYDYDSTHITEEGAYRVQGDLVLQAIPNDKDRMLERMYRFTLSSLIDALNHKTSRELTIRAIRLLSKLRLGCRVEVLSNFGGFDVPCSHPKFYDSAVQYIVDKIRDVPKKYHEAGNVCVTYDRGDILYFSVSFHSDPDYIRSLYNTHIQNVLKKVVYQKKEKTIIVGNHVIRALSYPTEAEIELPDLINGGTVKFRVSFIANPENSIITDEDIIIEHDEHPTTRVTLESGKVYIIVPRFTSVSVEDTIFRNNYVLDKLENESYVWSV